MFFVNSEVFVELVISKKLFDAVIMGQKGSKKSDLYVTEDTTLSNLPENQVKQYSGRAREYTAVDVSVDNNDPSKGWSKCVAFIVNVFQERYDVILSLQQPCGCLFIV